METPAAVGKSNCGRPRIQTLLALAITIAWSGHALFASAPQPTTASTTARVQYDQPGDGSLWALGRTYKCRFAPASESAAFTYVPFLGADAPRSYPLKLRLQSIEIGGRVLPLSAAQPVRENDRVVIDHGVVQEVYLLTPDSVEQEFIFAQRPGSPSNQGEVKIHVAVETDLAADEAGSALRFSNDRGAVNYTRAIAVDASGQRAAAPTSLTTASTIEITVPASVIADAAYPLTIDPIISTFTVAATSGSTAEQSPDVAYDASSNSYVIVWEHTVSATDGDVYSERYDSAGALIAGSFTAIDMTTANWRRPRVANNNVGDSHLVVANVGAVGLRQVWGRTRRVPGLSMSAQFQISDGAAVGEQFNADVGGDPFAGNPPSYFCAVWEHAPSPINHDIRARLVDQESSTVFGPVIPIDTSAATLDANPAIAKSNTNASVWTIVWERNVTPANGDIFGSQINFEGVILIPSYAIDTTAVDARRPAVSSLTTFGDYMVVFEGDPLISGDIQARVLNGAAVLGSDNLTLLEALAAAQPRVLPSVEADADRFVVASSQQVTPLNADAHISTYCFDGDVIQVAEQHRNLDSTAAYSDGVRLASVQGGGGPAGSHDFLIAWANRGSPTTGGPIRGARYQAKASCCRSDIVVNGATNVDDLLAVITGWGACANPSNCPADVNGDLTVNVDDLLAVIAGWGPCS